jgi:Family of unknown function (DUF6152)
MAPKYPVALMAAVTFLSMAPAAFAHHSYQAEFDAHKCMDMRGTLTKVNWDNPHMYFYMDTTDASGKVTSWAFEGHALAALQRSGTHKATLTDNIGKEVSVRACLAKNGEHKAAAEWLTTPDGVAHFIGVDVEHQ